MPSASCVNAPLPLDFVSDSFGVSRKFRLLTVIDDCTSGDLRRRSTERGTEFTTILKWADEKTVSWHDIDPRKPQKNAFGNGYTARGKADTEAPG